ncbi:sensor histidine kinase [Dongia sp.]|uniref:sensor histidine kinase n=1 Tax=Dongia sp. TaxID=1977262 RepID=UPI0035AD7A2F
MIGTFLRPLRHRLILLFAIVISVPSAFGIWAAIDNFHDQVATARAATDRFATLASNYESNLLWQSHQIVQNLSHDESVLLALRGGTDPRARDACNEAFFRAVKPYPSYGTAVLYDLRGDAVCQWDSSKYLTNVSHREWFNTVLATSAPTISAYLVSPALEEPIISFAAPIFDADGVFKGAISLGIRLNWLSAIGQEPGLPPIAHVILLDRHGKVLVGSANTDTHADLMPAPEYVERIVSGDLRAFEADDATATPRFFAVSALANNSLFVLLSIPRASIVDPLLRDMAIQIGIICLVSVAGMLAAIFGARILVTKWTEKLAAAANAMALGQLDMESELRGAPVEILQLSENLKAMAARIEHREADLRDSLAQKQLMLREIHHRVKNNLQIVTSLLNLYARLPRGDVFREAFGDLRMRINALALVHRHLYESEDLKEIDLVPFMQNLCALLQDGSGVSPRRVALNVEFPELRMSGSRAVPLALLTTEIVSNSFKHAFPDGRTGVIDVVMAVDNDGNGTLAIADNGIGPATQLAGSPTATMGTTLIAAFAKQLGGQIRVAGPPGTTTTIDFDLRGATRPN